MARRPSAKVRDGDENAPPSKGDEGDAPIVKTRASQACQGCRKRRIRCDLTVLGAPCHNCRLDDVECVLLESRRSRQYRLKKLRAAAAAAAEAASAQSFSLWESPPPATASQDENGGLFNIFPAQNTRRTSHSTHTEDARCKHLYQTPIQSTSPLPTCIAPAQSAAAIFDSSKTADARSPTSIAASSPDFSRILSLICQDSVDPATQSANSPPVVRRLEANLPSYIATPLREIGQEDLEILIRKGALSVPDTELRDHLIRCFILYVYPYHPVICLQDFLHAIETNGQDGVKISLNVFQGVMFAASAFVDEKLLRAAGFEDRRSVRAHFYSKLKLLYSFDWEVDRIALIQAILLHAHWYGSENEQKDPWHWLGICISLGMSLGLNDKYTYISKDPATRKLWRRLWWCCYIRDRIMAVATRKPMRFTDDHMRLPMLNFEDFDLQEISSTIQPVQKAFSIMTYDCRVTLAEMCMAKVKVLSIIGRTLERLYTLQAFHGPSTGRRMLYSPKTSSQISIREFDQLANDLDKWSDQLPTSCQIQYNNLEEPTAHFLHLHRVYLKMMSLLAIEAIHRPLSLSTKQSTLATENLYQRSQPIVRDCAMQTAGLVQSLRERGLFPFMPSVTISCLATAVATLLAELRSSDRPSSDLWAPKFQHCIRGLWSLREIWHTADHACLIVGKMIRASLQIKAVRQSSTTPSPATGTSQSGDRSRQTPVVVNGFPVHDRQTGPSPRSGHDLFLASLPDLGGSQPDLMGDLFSGFEESSWTAADFGLYDGFSFDGRSNGVSPIPLDREPDNDLLDNMMASSTFTPFVGGEMSATPGHIF